MLRSLRTTRGLPRLPPTPLPRPGPARAPPATNHCISTSPYLATTLRVISAPVSRINTRLDLRPRHRYMHRHLLARRPASWEWTLHRPLRIAEKPHMFARCLFLRPACPAHLSFLAMWEYQCATLEETAAALEEDAELFAAWVRREAGREMRGGMERQGVGMRGRPGRGEWFVGEPESWAEVMWEEEKVWGRVEYADLEAVRGV